MLNLAQKPDSHLNNWSQSAILGDRGVAARNFADLVAARLIGTVLPLSERESLIRTGARNGINRFEANLLIAAVQHQLGIGRKRQQSIQQQTPKRFTMKLKIPSALATFITIQAGIIAAVWYMISR